jgi:hypothetical protein
MNTKLYGICWKEEHFSAIGARYDAWDNLTNQNPELREFPIFEQAFNSSLTKNLDYWGMISAKFDAKAGIKGEAFLDWVKTENSKSNPSDVYFLNPVPIVEALFPGTIQHGEICHSGLLGILQRNLTEAKNINLATLYMDCNTFAMCNYFVGNRKFWSKYVAFVNIFLDHVKSNPADYDLVYNTGANYGPNKSLPFYSFVVERLFSIFLNLYANEISFSHYQYTRDALLVKTGLSANIVDELRCLSDIKQVAISGRYTAMMEHWSFLRNRMAQANQYLFLME